jgi:hypothetical protein
MIGPLGVIIAVAIVVWRNYIKPSLARLETAGTEAKPPNGGFKSSAQTAPPKTMYVIVRRDNKVWAGPWHNNGTTFSTVPARWYKYKTAAEAQHEVDTNDFLRHCTVEEDS